MVYFVHDWVTGGGRYLHVQVTTRIEGCVWIINLENDLERKREKVCESLYFIHNSHTIFISLFKLLVQSMIQSELIRTFHGILLFMAWTRKVGSFV